MTQAAPAPRRLDASAAWNHAIQLVSSNREMLLAIAGVFLMLPSLVLEVMVPEPPMPPGATQEQMMQAMGDFWVAALPWLIPALLLNLTGAITLQIVMTDRTRPTVAQAIGRGFGLMPSFLGAQLLTGVAVMLGGSVLLVAAALTGMRVMVSVTAVALLVGVLYLTLRLILIPSVLAVEGIRSPLQLLRRSWVLTSGTTGAIALFVGLALLVFLIVSGLATALVDLILSFTAGGVVQHVLGAAVSAGFAGVGMVYFAAMQVAMHRQLSGAGTTTASAFE